eukprot:scaffold18246_cov79-Attheya_sp.AAC.1
MFKKEVMQATCENETLTYQKCMLLKPLLSRRDNEVLQVGTKHINTGIIQSAAIRESEREANSRQDYSRSVLRCVKKRKKALAFAHIWLNLKDEQNYQCPSGKVFEDLCEYVLDEMFKLLKDGDEENNDCEEETNTIRESS